MATAKLIFQEEDLDRDSVLFALYDRFYQGMQNANAIESPDYYSNPPLSSDGSIDVNAIEQGLKAYSTIQMKNSAYNMANAIVLSFGGGSGGAGGGFLSRGGDSMSGQLNALFGFQSGENGQTVLQTIVGADNKGVAKISGRLEVSDGAVFGGALNVAENGIVFTNSSVVRSDEQGLLVESPTLSVSENLNVGNRLKIGNTVITTNGILWGDKEFYHKGNSNNIDTDWSMKNATVGGDLTVDGNTLLSGKFKALGGYSIGHNGNTYLDSTDDGVLVKSHLLLNSDVRVGWNGVDNLLYADGRLFVNNPESSVVLGGDGTEKITLHSSIYNHSDDYIVVSKYGDGNFKNSFSAGVGNGGATVVRTYHNSNDDFGIMFPHGIRLGNTSEVVVTSDGNALLIELPFSRYDTNSNVRTAQIPLTAKYQPTNSLFRNQSLSNSATLHLHTGAEMVAVDNPLEAKSFSIISQQYKTRLGENVLFFNDGVFIESVSDGIRHSGNSYFDGNISSRRFSSGLAGYGWGVIRNELTGNASATFDELTIRKKMRVYELEVQKASVTNGSLWISDACSGDFVEEL